MPAATTHIEFSKEVLEKLRLQEKKRIKNIHMYYLGSQGPDMLFFSRASILPGSLKPYGNLMHDEKVYEVIYFFEQFAGKDPDLNSYISGYLCHYALDSLAHPLINAVARYRHNEEGLNESESHIISEGDIDVWLLHQRGRKISSYSVFDEVVVDKNSREKLAKMYHYMFEKVFQVDIPIRKISDSINDIANLTKLLYPTKKNYDRAYKLESLFSMPHCFSGMILYNHNDTTVLNLNHQKYPLAYDHSQTISASFPQLYGKAIFLAKRLIEGHAEEDFQNNFNGVPKEVYEEEKNNA
ncbi:MAG: zinc dependent phospholipase C family protein [Solobacterium sp.]|nr:zinc dependent phospholipase C family protein [Solobacterium sp.]